MKKILLFIATVIFLGCSDDDSKLNDCEKKKLEINEKFDAQIQYVMNYPGLSGSDYKIIGVINQQRDYELAHACD